MKHWRLACCVLLCCILSSNTASAANEKSKLEKLSSKIASLQHSLLGKTKKKQSLTDELEQLEKQISQASINVHAVQQQINRENKKLRPLKKQQSKLQQKLTIQRTALAKQIRAIYQVGQHSYLQLFLNQQDPSQISRLSTYYQTVNQARSQLINNFNASLQQVQQNQQAINKVLATLTPLKKKRVAERKRLQKTQAARKVLLRKLNREIKSSKKRITRLQADKRHLQKVVNTLKAEKAYQKFAGTSFGKLRKRLPWPVKGRITRSYGQRYDGRLISNGVFISAKVGQVVRAIAAGQVVFANWLRGYGNMLIISHKGGYMTLYAHNNALLANVGDNIKPGQDIALVGNSGGLIHPGLYFEIRYKGKTRDPSAWCR